jgi:hypothetical protein
MVWPRQGIHGATKQEGKGFKALAMSYPIIA